MLILLFLLILTHWGITSALCLRRSLLGGFADHFLDVSLSLSWDMFPLELLSLLVPLVGHIWGSLCSFSKVHFAPVVFLTQFRIECPTFFFAVMSMEQSPKIYSMYKQGLRWTRKLQQCTNLKKYLRTSWG